MLGNTSRRLSRHFTATLLAGSCALALLGNAAYAADLDAVEQTPEPSPSYPLIEGSFVFELESDGIFSDDGDDEFVDTFNTTEVALDVRFNSIFSLHTDITLEPVEAPNAGPRALGDDIFFEDHGFFFETLHLQADFEHFSLYGGKINPSFGSAWDVTPGLYGVDFAEDYEITERIGVGGSYTFKTESAGEHTINAATFFADTSGLSRSFGTNRGRTAEIDGGASNTESFESFSVSIDGGEIEALPGFTYNAGFRFQTAGIGDFDDEVGFVVGAVQELELSNDVTLTLNGEIGYFDNFDGGDADNLYATIGAGITYEKWFGDAAFSVRDVSSNVGADDFTDLQFQAGIGREVFKNATLEVGYRYLREEDNDSHTIGAIFVYETDFKILRP
ncbi:MAG: hypothetical protein ABJN04_08350 [Hyphomicrobiales bacterium]